MSSSSPSSPGLLFSSINLSSSFLVSYILFLYLSSPFLLQLSSAAAAADHQTCVHEQFTTLLDLKQSFNLNSSDSNLSSWNTDNRDCCSWEGVACNTSTGHVIALNLGGLGISGLFDFQSLFRLRSLQKLDLFLNDFRGPPIPSGFHHLSRLAHLILSFCRFYGQIPLDFSRLTRLASLDLSHNTLPDCPFRSPSKCGYSLSLKHLGMRGLLQNLSSLTELHLDLVDLSSETGQALSSAALLTLISRN